MVNKQNFYLSAFIAFASYMVIILLVLYYVKVNDVKKIDAIEKLTVLQLDLVFEEETTQKESLTIKTKTKVNKIENEVVKKTTSTSVKKRTDLKSLFANVKTSSKKVSKEKILNVKQSSIASRFKSKFEKDKKVENIKNSKLITKRSGIKKIENIQMNQSKESNDPYFSKIYQILSSRWIPTIFSDNIEAKVIISISSNGKFSYKFIQYSNNIGFDKQLKDFLEIESYKIYPINPTKKDTNIEILFQSKG
ncbi:MAG: TonB C-terminal domain-containing protein [Campylobacterota bacterium]|nr:TonB C-terminal domain-containing protein [Campylobacterota bacterium]